MTFGAVCCTRCVNAESCQYKTGCFAAQNVVNEVNIHLHNNTPWIKRPLSWSVNIFKKKEKHHDCLCRRKTSR